MLNEERQTDKELPGQTNGEMEGGWGILKISLGGGGEVKHSWTQKARETQPRMGRWMAEEGE